MNKPLPRKRTKALISLTVLSALIFSFIVFGIASSSPNNAAELQETAFVTAGANTTQIITKNGERLSRGQNDLGQLGVENYDNQKVWAQGKGGYVKLSSPYDHTIAITDEGYVSTWGGNRFNALTGNSNAALSSPKDVTASAVYETLSAGPDFVVALDRAGNLFAWGNNGSGQLGTGDTKGSTKPVLISAGTQFVQVKAGKNFVVAIDRSGFMWAWGANQTGQLGIGNTIDQFVPVKVSEQTWNFVDASLVSETVVAIDSSGNLFTWGNNDYGQLGNGVDWRGQQQEENNRVAREIQAIKDADAKRRQNLIDSCESERGRELAKWEQEQEDAKPKPTPSPTPPVDPDDPPVVVPTPTPTPVEPTRPKPSWDTTCVQMVDASFEATSTSHIVPRTIVAPKLKGTSTVPVNVSNGRQYVSASIGSQNGFAIDVSGNLYGWGTDASGQTGIGLGDKDTHSQAPVRVAYSSTFFQVEAGDRFAAAVTSSGALVTWGSNNKVNSLGDGADSRHTPTVIKDGVSAVFVGVHTGFALDTAKIIHPWGAGVNGLLADSKDTPSSNIFSAGQAFNLVTPSVNGVVALNTSNQFVTWGKNVNGIFANGATSEEITAVERNTISKFIDVAAGRFFSVMVDGNGVVWGVGYSALGQLGPYGTNATTSQPVIIPLPVKVKLVAAGQDSAYAVGEDDSVWVWGNSNPNPVKIGQLTDGVKQLSAGHNHLMVLDGKGNIWEYGSSTVGNVGFKTYEELTKFTATTTYVFVAAGGDTSMAITTDGVLVGWGDNSNHQLLAGFIEKVPQQTVLNDVEKFVSVSVSSTHALAVDDKGVIYGWGSEPFGTFDGMVSSTDSLVALPVFDHDVAKENN